MNWQALTFTLILRIKQVKNLQMVLSETITPHLALYHSHTNPYIFHYFGTNPQLAPGLHGRVSNISKIYSEHGLGFKLVMKPEIRQISHGFRICCEYLAFLLLIYSSFIQYIHMETDVYRGLYSSSFYCVSRQRSIQQELFIASMR